MYIKYLLFSANIRVSSSTATAELIAGIKELSKKMDVMVSLFDEATKQMKTGMDEPLMKRLETLSSRTGQLPAGLYCLKSM